MTNVKLQSFNDTDVTFLKEHRQVMGNVAKTLDVVQGKNHSYLWCLLPTLAITLTQLREKTSGSASRWWTLCWRQSWRRGFGMSSRTALPAGRSFSLYVPPDLAGTA